MVVTRSALLTNVKVAKTAAVPKQQRKAPLAGFELGWTPENEVFVSRMAMLGFGSAVVGEYFTGNGILSQLSYEIGLQQTQVGLFLAGLVGFNLLASLLPNSATFKRNNSNSSPPSTETPVGPLQNPKITLLDGPKKFFGVTDWGFTPQNELFAGRLASLGVVAAILGELATGLGPVGQLSAETGVSSQNIFFALAAWASFMALTAVDKLAVKKPASTKKGKTVSSKTTSTAPAAAEAQ